MVLKILKILQIFLDKDAVSATNPTQKINLNNFLHVQRLVGLLLKKVKKQCSDRLCVNLSGARNALERPSMITACPAP